MAADNCLLENLKKEGEVFLLVYKFTELETISMSLAFRYVYDDTFLPMLCEPRSNELVLL